MTLEREVSFDDEHLFSTCLYAWKSQDPFSCNECGHSRFGKLELGATAALTADYCAVTSDEDVQQALDSLSSVTQESQNLQKSLQALHK
jgi:hypothetical protein